MTHRTATSFDVSSFTSQSPPDLRVRSEMWKGQVPVLFELAPHEVTSMEVPPPLAMLVPRMSYFPLVLGDVRTHFRDMTPAMEDELWLEYDGMPLKWNIPIGVLFDLLCPSVPVADGSFPLKKLLRCKTLFTVRQHFLNTWKESCYIRFASSRIAMSCLATDHQKMWDSLLHLREDIHVQTNARILTSGLLGGQNTSGTSYLSPAGHSLVQAALEHKSVEDLPIRIYFHCTKPTHEEGMLAEGHMTPMQRSIKPKQKGGHESTLADLVQSMLPTLIDPSKQPSAGSNEIALQPNVRLTVQGFCPPLSTPLPWLCTYCAHPDGFLYLSVHIVEAESEEELMARDPFGHGNSSMMMQSGMMGGGMDTMLGGSSSLYGNLGGLVGSVANFTPSALPGYHAASNAVNVVYQNLPSLPALPVTIPSMTSLFGGSPAQSQLASQQPSSQLQSAAIPFSSASAMDSPPPQEEAPIGEIEAAPEDQQPPMMRVEQQELEPSHEDLP